MWRLCARTANSTRASQTRFWLMGGACGHAENAGAPSNEQKRAKERKGAQSSTGGGSERSRSEEGKTQGTARAEQTACPLREGSRSGLDEAFQLQERDGRSEARENRHQYGSRRSDREREDSRCRCQ